ncbi:MAG: D-tyrosyl-tRNA(Tyr) deacylase [Acidobacteria bacterium]|nr:MAG: D-tyrosyl-tRNA(Tyr) deacylase [Acidobacteriota bacterium]
MRGVIQRVKQANVTVEGKTVAAIGTGLLVFLGVEKDDSETACERAARKIAGLRVFEDENGKMNRSVSDIGGEILMVSQFTVAGSIEKGRRPSFDNAMEPEAARLLFEKTVVFIRDSGIPVQTGVFQAHMDVSLINDGPATFILEK